ncbi:hypothetical protein [aff. Roholtiella sp. LEGE 12411]|nr:hypothetical protein [aff. Roholtiella sp. LEGE 12411]MBE9037897.1 hypothetical protein [aff. Roholtiella sp. LEGE 12411]
MPSRVLKLFVGVEDRLFDGWAFISWQYAKETATQINLFSLHPKSLRV